MNIPENLLNELKCSQCFSYLSCGPVNQLHTGQMICGRCLRPTEPCNRVRSYEALARLVLFPCKNRDVGCTKKLQFSLEGQPHEAECAHRPYVCPVAGPTPCEWLGNRAHLLQHCRDQHPEQVVNNPYTMEHDIKRSSNRTYLLLKGHLLFLLHAKVCLTSRSILHCVRYLGDPANAVRFSYLLTVVNGSESLVKSGTVTPEGCRVIQEDISIAVPINGLLQVLGGFSGVKFTVRVDGEEKKDSEKCYQTSVVQPKVEQREALGVICSKGFAVGWQFDILGWKPCRNSRFGCTYRDVKAKCGKHEWFHCQYRSQCFSCDMNIQPGSLYEHYVRKHGAVTHRSGTLWRCVPQERGCQYCYITSTTTTLCKYWMINSEFELYIYINATTEYLRTFTCILELTNPNTKYTITKELDTLYDRPSDWYLTINIYEPVFYNKECDIQITIQKSN